jgi:hypothetical protein
MSDSYQAIYDAVRSRISNGDVGAAIERVAFQAFDISHAREIVTQEICYAASQVARPSAVYRPEISLDGNCYCALYGKDLMSGCAGFGETMADAMADFDKNWATQKAPVAKRVA